MCRYLEVNYHDDLSKILNTIISFAFRILKSESKPLGCPLLLKPHWVILSCPGGTGGVRVETMAASSSTSLPKPTIGILSIGEMGGGIARLLIAHDYTVVTSIEGRSKSTAERVKAAKIVALPTDEAFVAESDIILSIVPPRDAVATARRVLEATRSSNAAKQRAQRKNLDPARGHAITYIDMNAVSSRTTKTIAGIITAEASPAAVKRRQSSVIPFVSSSPDTQQSKPITIDYLDGGIIGGPPSLKATPPDSNESSGASSSSTTASSWKKPSLVISGPKLDLLLPFPLQSTLNIKPLDAHIGTASTLKCCFASLTKGTTALAILSYTTAHTAGVLDELRSHLADITPGLKNVLEAGMVGMPPKAYRWVEEMRQIGETFATEGGFDASVMGDGMGGGRESVTSPGGSTTVGLQNGNAMPVYDGIASVYKIVADDTVLGEERTEKRKRGKDAVDIAACMGEGLRRKRKRSEEKAREGELGVTWRGSWS